MCSLSLNLLIYFLIILFKYAFAITFINKNNKYILTNAIPINDIYLAYK